MNKSIFIVAEIGINHNGDMKVCKKLIDLADACLFLGSDLASYINGQEIYVDGGWLSKGLKKD